MAKIKASDLYVNDGAVAAGIKELELLQTTYLKLIQTTKGQAIQLQTQLKQTTVASSEQRSEIQKGAKQADKLEKELRKYTDSLKDNAVKIEAVRNATKTMNQLNRNAAKEAAAAEGSYNQLSAQYSQLKIRINQLSKEQRENDPVAREMIENSKAIFEEMKRLQAETGKTSLNVGNYSDALRELPAPLSNASRGIEGMKDSLKAILKNPFVAFVAAMVAGLAALGGAFLRTERGAKLFDQGMAVIDAGLSGLSGVIDNVADSAEKFISENSEGFKRFSDFIVTEFIGRIEGAVGAVFNLGQSLFKLAKGDLSGFKKEAGEFAESVDQAFRGLDNADESVIVNKIKETAKAAKDSAKPFVDLANARLRVQRANRSLAKSIEELTTIEERNNAIESDSTKSFLEREQATEKAGKAAEERAKKEAQIAKNNLSLLNTEIDIRTKNGERVEDLLDRQLAAYREVAAAEREILTSRLENEKTASELEQDRLERDLDILIDGFENQKQINLDKIRNDQTTFEEKRKLLEKTDQLSDDSFAKQIETIQKFTGVQLDANEFIKESDAVVLNQKIRGLGLSEIIEGRLLEIVRDRKSAIQDLTSANQDLIDAEVKSITEAVKAQKEKADKLFKEEQDFESSKFELTKRTEKEKSKFSLEQEKQRIERLLILNEGLSDRQIEIYKNQVKRIEREIGEIEGGGNDIFKLLGFNLSDENKKSLSDALNFAKQQVLEFAKFRTDLAKQNLDNQRRETDAANENLNRQLELRAAGLANKADEAAKELQIEEDKEKERLKALEKSQKAERRLQTIQQAGNLVTASAKIFSQLGFPAAIPAIAIMFGAFAAAKIKAAKLAKKEFGKGGYKILGGGKHGSGNDTDLGFQVEGKQAFAEKGEGVAIFAADKTKKYGSIIPELVKAINSGTLETRFGAIGEASRDYSINIQGGSSSADMRETNGHLAAIRKQGEERVEIVNGKKQITTKNRITIFE